MPVHFYPVIGSSDCITVAVVAVDGDGNGTVKEANNLDSLVCLFGARARDYIIFIRLTISCIRDELGKTGGRIFDDPINLGSAFRFGEPTMGSGFDLESIANSWLGKISLVHDNDVSVKDIVFSDLSTKIARDIGALSAPRERKIIPAIRDEVSYIAPQFLPNFNREFLFKGRSVPVKLNYNGERLVAGFDRVAPKNIAGSLEKIRSKLWVLAEHRDQTLHENPKEHEMLVIPTTLHEPILSSRELDAVNTACSDIEEEADRREIRFRLFPSPRDVAVHIFQVESGPRSAPRLQH